jgi:hypothetical protein
MGSNDRLLNGRLGPPAVAEPREWVGVGQDFRALELLLGTADLDFCGLFSESAWDTSDKNLALSQVSAFSSVRGR